MTNVELLPLELELVSDTDFILTKNTIIKKLTGFFQKILENQQQVINKYATGFPDEILQPAPKISRGENYKGLPWLMLDHPRLFEKDNVFAIRTMFWWGNFFSTTLHISGRYKKLLEDKLLSAYTDLAERNFYLCNSRHEWEHHFDSSNYTQISSVTKDVFTKITKEKNFLKTACKHPVQPLQFLKELLVHDFNILVKSVC